MKLPVIVGFGGFNPAGRISFHHAYKRTVIDALNETERQKTYQSLATLMGLQEDVRDASTQAYINDHTLIRKIELWDPASTNVHKKIAFEASGNHGLRFRVAIQDMPSEVPPTWETTQIDSKYVDVEVHDSQSFLMEDTQRSRVSSAGQLPTGFDPGSVYESRNHPRALQLAIAGGSDAIRSTGLDWDLVNSKIEPDQVAVYAGSAMGQLDNEGAAGLLQAPLLGKRPTSKQAALSLPEMPADFINAYVTGSMGSTGGIIGACATFLYNVRQGIDEIRFRNKRVAIVGSAEAPITPELVEAYRTMRALAEDSALMKLDNSATVDHRRACRPFSSNAGFTMAEAGSYLVLMDDELALEIGANIHGSVADVYVNADGFKKSIPGPGVGNYLTVGKALGLTKAIIGENGVQNRTFVHAHGTGTPQNRVTESHILDLMAKTFGIEKWPVAAIKAFLGHTLAPASGDQITSALGTWQYGIVPGIATIDHIAEDVYSDNLRISPEHLEVDPSQIDAALVNSKGFGGNNATGVLLSPALTTQILEKRHGQKVLREAAHKRETTLANALEYDELAMATNPKAIYKFGEGVLEGEDLGVSSKSIQVPGYELDVDLEVENPYE